jgi:tRNA(fMet)-specific endonuclease VapC
MKRYLLDSNALTDFIDDRRGVKQRAEAVRRAGAKIGTCFPVLAETYSGLEGSTSRDRNIRLLKAGLVRLTLWPFDHAAAEEYGRLFAHLLRIGRPMQVVDVMVAAIALSLGNCTVVTTDSDLSAVPGLSVENWAAP